MLQELFIRNFALIEEMRLDYGAGLNVLTGETGAGKSILIDAVGLLLGNRASVDYIRTGSPKSFVQGVFAVDGKLKGRIANILGDLGIEPEDDDQLILTREVSESGKNSCRINGHTVTLSAFQNLSSQLIEIHGQNTTQQLLSAARQAELLDRLGGSPLLSLREQIQKHYKKMQLLMTEKSRLEDVVSRGLREKDFLQFQIEEIAAAALTPGEEERLEAELRKISNAQALQEAFEAAGQDLLSGQGLSPSAYDLTSRTLDRFKNLRGLDEPLDRTLEELAVVADQLQDIALQLRQYAQEGDFDEYRLDEIESRLSLIHQLKRKYGPNIGDILSLEDTLRTQLEEIEHAAKRLEGNEQVYKEEQQKYNALDEAIHNLRKETAAKTEQKIQQVLKELSMPDVRFSVSFTRMTQPGPHGTDHIDFLISPNPGEPLKPLAKIASGGELSRTMLAIKSILSEVDRIPVLIFDEIDSGIGGNVLRAVAQRMAQISAHSQVICVTHAPQIAAYADAHYFIYKKTEKNKTTTHIAPLITQADRAKELTRMLGSTAKAKEHADELLRSKEVRMEGKPNDQ